MANLIEENFIDYKDMISELNPGTLHVIPGICNHDFTATDLAYSIDYYFKKKNKTNIMLCDYLEAPNPKFLILMNEIAKKLVDEYNYDPDILIYGCNFIPVDLNYNKLNALYENNDIQVKTLINYLFFELEWSYILNNPIKPNLDSLHLRNIRNKKFLMFTGSLRPHRVYLLYHIIKHQLDNDGYFSVLSSKENYNQFFGYLNPRYKNDPYMTELEDIKKVIQNYPKEFPINLSSVIGDNPSQHTLSDMDVNLFANSYFSIIPETSFYQRSKIDDEINHWNFHLDFTFVTEKTFRAIAALHPFVMASRPYTLDSLRRLGYKTFHPYIDESYDNIEEDDLRLKKICQTISDLCKKTDQEWLQFQKDTYPIVLHNQKRLLEAYPLYKRTIG